jgi:hypothetical protein
LLASLLFCRVLLTAGPKENSLKPQYGATGNLMRPADYRDWEFLSAGYGMSYSPAPGSREMFTNVFVQRWAYADFLKSGKWPEQSNVCNRREQRRERRLDQQDGTLSNRPDDFGSRG